MSAIREHNRIKKYCSYLVVKCTKEHFWQQQQKRKRMSVLAIILQGQERGRGPLNKKGATWRSLGAVMCISVPDRFNPTKLTSN